jgi:hypothetical protein
MLPVHWTDCLVARPDSRSAGGAFPTSSAVGSQVNEDSPWTCGTVVLDVGDLRIAVGTRADKRQLTRAASRRINRYASIQASSALADKGFQRIICRLTSC